MTDPYHAGERLIQEKTGERDTAVANGQVIAARIPERARSFVSQQRACILAWTEPNGGIWASFLVGPEGFASTTEDLAGLEIHLADETGLRCKIPPLDRLGAGENIATLFIELATRRRLRINGTVAALDRERLLISVNQAYPNCPKYIQRRQLVDAPAVQSETPIETGQLLTGAIISWIEQADTFFVASAHPDGAMDASHRGGAAGFVTLRDGALRIPDYPGNSMFNTLGNLALNPHAGLVFVDFEQGRQLQLSGDAQLDLDAGEQASATGGTGRWWEFRPQSWIVSPLNIPLAWRFVDPSPFNS